MIDNIKNLLNNKVVSMIKDDLGRIIYQAIRKVAISGILPLTLEKSTGENLVNYTIYGSASGVGTKTDNLIDYTQAYARTAGQTVRIDTENNAVIWSGNYFFYVPVVIPAGTTLVFDCEGEYRYKWAVHYVDGGNSANVLNGEPITLEKDIDAIMVYKSTVATTVQNMVFKNLMLNYGEEVKTYEPYGYKIPVITSNNNNSITTNIYIDIPLYEGKSVNYNNDELPPIPTFEGDTVIDSTVNNKPNVDIEYMRK